VEKIDGKLPFLFVELRGFRLGTYMEFSVFESVAFIILSILEVSVPFYEGEEI
jgi:hypothetical protein